MLDAGVEPRTRLTYAIPVGSAQSFEMTVDMRMDMGSMGGVMTLPRLAMTGDVAIAASPAPASVAYTLTTRRLEFIDRPGAAMPASAINAKLGGVQHMVATGTLAPTGKVSNFAIDAHEASADVVQSLSGLRQSYDQMVTQFPVAPLGVGGRWQIVADIDQNGMKAKQTATFEVVSITGTSVVLHNHVVLDAPSQTIVANGVQAELRSMKATGDAAVTVDRTRLLGPTTLTMHLVEELEAMGQSLTMAMDMDMAMSPK